MQTTRINNDRNFRELEAHAQQGLSAKGYKQESLKGSTSFRDLRIDDRVRFKLCFCSPDRRIFFGAREQWANEKGVSLSSIGSEGETVNSVRFRGEFIKNDADGKSKIDSIIARFP
jgi:hypothetical protein